MLQQTLSNPTVAASDNFGQAVSLSGGKALVGAPLTRRCIERGQAYLIDTASGNLLFTLPNPSPTVKNSSASQCRFREPRARRSSGE